MSTISFPAIRGFKIEAELVAADPKPVVELRQYVPQQVIDASSGALQAIDSVLTRSGFMKIGAGLMMPNDRSSIVLYMDRNFTRVRVSMRPGMYLSKEEEALAPANPPLISDVRVESVLGMTVISEYFDPPSVYLNDSTSRTAVTPLVSDKSRDDMVALPYLARLHVVVKMLEMINWTALGDNLNMALRGNETARFWAEETASGEFEVRENALAWREESADAAGWRWFNYAGAKNTVLKNHHLRFSVKPGAKVGLRPVRGNRCRVMVPELGEKSTFTLNEATARTFMSRLERSRGRGPAPSGSQPAPRPQPVVASEEAPRVVSTRKG